MVEKSAQAKARAQAVMRKRMGRLVDQIVKSKRAKDVARESRVERLQARHARRNKEMREKAGHVARRMEFWRTELADVPKIRRSNPSDEALTKANTRQFRVGAAVRPRDNVERQRAEGARLAYTRYLAEHGALSHAELLDTLEDHDGEGGSGMGDVDSIETHGSTITVAQAHTRRAKSDTEVLRELARKPARERTTSEVSILVERLRAIPFFKALAVDKVVEIVKVAQIAQYARNEVVFDVATPDDTAVVVLAGELVTSETKHVPAPAPADGSLGAVMLAVSEANQRDEQLLQRRTRRSRGEAAPQSTPQALALADDDLGDEPATVQLFRRNPFGHGKKQYFGAGRSLEGIDIWRHQLVDRTEEVASIEATLRGREVLRRRILGDASDSSDAAPAIVVDDRPQRITVSATIGVGAAVGLPGLLRHGQRSCKCSTTARSVLLSLTRSAFHDIVRDHSTSELTAHVDNLKRFPLFEGLQSTSLRRIASAVIPVRYSAGDKLLAGADVSETLYLIVSGRCREIVSNTFECEAGALADKSAFAKRPHAAASATSQHYRSLPSSVTERPTAFLVAGHYFGDAGVSLGLPDVVDIVADTDVSIYLLPKLDCRTRLSRTIRGRMENIAISRLRHNRAARGHVCSTVASIPSRVSIGRDASSWKLPNGTRRIGRPVSAQVVSSRSTQPAKYHTKVPELEQHRPEAGGDGSGFGAREDHGWKTGLRKRPSTAGVTRRPLSSSGRPQRRTIVGDGRGVTQGGEAAAARAIRRSSEPHAACKPLRQSQSAGQLRQPGTDLQPNRTASAAELSQRPVISIDSHTLQHDTLPMQREVSAGRAEVALMDGAHSHHGVPASDRRLSALPESVRMLSLGDSFGKKSVAVATPSDSALSQQVSGRLLHYHVGSVRHLPEVVAVSSVVDPHPVVAAALGIDGSGSQSGDSLGTGDSAPVRVAQYAFVPADPDNPQLQLVHRRKQLRRHRQRVSHWVPAWKSEAAIEIQRMARGFLGRQLSQKIRRNTGATVIQSLLRRVLATSAVQGVREGRSASLIQAIFRGRQGRKRAFSAKKLHLSRRPIESPVPIGTEQENAAAKVQAVYRGRMARTLVRGGQVGVPLWQRQAAVQIQRVARGGVIRRRMIRQQRHHAAVAIQKMSRGFGARSAVRRIQANVESTKRVTIGQSSRRRRSIAAELNQRERRRGSVTAAMEDFDVLDPDTVELLDHRLTKELREVDGLVSTVLRQCCDSGGWSTHPRDAATRRAGLPSQVQAVAACWISNAQIGNHAKSDDDYTQACHLLQADIATLHAHRKVLIDRAKRSAEARTKTS